MQGTVYKELVQNRFFLLCGLFLPPLVYIAVILIGLILHFGETGFSWEGFFSEFLADGAMFPSKLLILLFSYIGMRLLSASVFSQDESKRKSLLMAAVPDGTARQIYGKYVILFMAYALFFVSAGFTDSFMNWIVFCLTGKTTPSMLNLLALILFAQLFLRSIEIPFYVRYSARTGKYVLIILMILIMLAMLFVMLYVPSFGNILTVIWDWYNRLLNGELAEESVFLISVFPPVSIAAYLISYRISCKLWLKGVANYE